MRFSTFGVEGKQLVFGFMGLALLVLVKLNHDFEQIEHRLSDENEVKFGRRDEIFGRLGNRLFAVASTIGISRMHGLEPCIGPKFKFDAMLKHFKNIPYCVGEKGNVTVWEEAMFYGPIDKTDPTFNANDVEIKGYGQSFKYFENAENEVINAFELSDDIQQISKKFVEDYSDFIKIGIHVRRTDMVNFSSMYGGYPKNGFYANAMAIMREKYGSSVKFFVATDDYKWAEKQTLFNVIKDVILIRHDAIEDFAVLRQCDHMIMGLGTYAWWAAYLGAHQKGGDVIYFQKDLENPFKSKVFNPVDFYLDTWFPVTDHVTEVE